MKIKKPLFINCCLAIWGAITVILLSCSGALNHFEFNALDFSYQLRPSRADQSKICIIEITDTDIEKIGRWPWKRSWLAAMARSLSGLGAKSIYFDIILSEPSDEADDALLEQAVKLSDNVYLPFVFQQSGADMDTAVLPIKRFSSFLKGMGAVNIYPDADGTIRRIKLNFATPQGLKLHAALQIAMDYQGLKLSGSSAERLKLTLDGLTTYIPLTREGDMLLSWAGKWNESFRRYSFLEVLSGYKDYAEGKPLPASLLGIRGSICLVGMTAIGLYDIKPIPIQAEFPGVGIIANAINNILNKDFIYIPRIWVFILAILLLGLLPAFVISGEYPRRESLTVSLLAVGYYFIHIMLFKRGVYTQVVAPLLGLVLSSLTIGVYSFVRVALEKQDFLKLSIIDGLTGLFNIRHFKRVLESEVMMASTDPQVSFVILMSDIDHFKQFNDSYGHQVGDLVLRETASVLKNSVRHSDVVARYGGEEMIILLRGTGLKEGLIVAEKLRKNVESRDVKDASSSYKITISIGVAAFKAGDDVEKLIKRADDALYKAKATGRNRVCSILEDFVRFPSP